MSLLTLKTDDGRSVTVEEFRVRYSAINFLCGTEQDMRLRLIRRLPEVIKKEFGVEAFVLREPPVAKLPTYTCFLFLTSLPFQKGLFQSELVIVWFSYELPKDLEAECQVQLKGVKWERQAKDVHF